MTVYSETVIEDLRSEIKDKDKEIARLNSIILKFKKYYDSWPKFITQLGLKDDNPKQQETNREGI